MERIQARNIGADAAEQQEKAKAVAALPRITPAEVEATIAAESFFTAEEGVKGAMLVEHGFQDYRHPRLALHTFCVLTLNNGFIVTGESSWESSDNFSAETGRKIARANAFSKIWPLMICEMRSRQANQQSHA